MKRFLWAALSLCLMLAFTSDSRQLVVGGLFAEDSHNQIYVLSLPS